jgi:hypothetical protein
VKPEVAGEYDVVVTVKGEGAGGGGVSRSAGARLRVMEADPEQTGEPAEGSAMLRSLARGSGGRVQRGSGGEVKAYLEGLPREKVERTEAVRAELWRSPWYVLVAIGMLMTEWYLRRRGQLE